MTQTRESKPVPKAKAESRAAQSWIREMPQNWEAVKLKYLISQPITDGPHTTPEFTQQGIPFLSVDGIQEGNLFFEKTRFISVEDHELFKAKAFPKRDDILMGKAASIGKIARVKVDFEFSIWSPLALIRPNTQHIHSTYLEFALKSTYLQAQIENLCTSNTQKNISMDDIPSLLFLLPPLELQQRIADYLDAETAHIDNLIREKEKMLELLEEKRAALISQVVTKGLDDRVPMKESGLEWIDMIPAHWRVLRAKQIFIQSDLPVRIDDEVVTCFRNGQVTLRSNRRSDGFMLAEKEVGYQGIRVGQLVLHSMDAFAGAIGVSDSDGKCSPEYIICNPKNKEVSNFYFSFLLRIMAQRGYIQAYCPAVRERAPRIRFNDFADMFLPFPDAKEQLDIVEHLDEHAEETKEIRVSLENSLELLRERRSALITAAVTGQLEI
jgi:type I restriction enzyme, S subunit